MRLLTFVFLIPFIMFSQDRSLDFAGRVFEICKANDKEQFQQFIASQAELTTFITDIDPSAPENMIAPAYVRYKSRALESFKQWQEMAADLELDFKTAVIIKSEVEDRPLDLKKDGKQLKSVTVTGVKIFFTCSGKNLCFIIYDAINVSEKYYLGNDPVQLHWLD